MGDEQKQEAVRYSVEELQARARTKFGVSPHVVAGALAGERRETHTEAQAEKAINAFQKRADETVRLDAEPEEETAA